MIIVEADDEDEIHRISNRIGEICLKHGAVDVFVPGSERAKRNLLEAREKCYTAMQHFGILDITDVVVPRSMIAEFVERAQEISNEYGIPVIALGHAGDGNVHICLMGKDTDSSEEKTEGLLTRIFEVGVSLGGTVSGEHGLGSAKKAYLPMVSDRSKTGLMKRIKKAFDPNNIMNPGKVFDLD
jgi:glycolate oxidase